MHSKEHINHSLKNGFYLLGTVFNESVYRGIASLTYLNTLHTMQSTVK